MPESQNTQINFAMQATTSQNKSKKLIDWAIQSGKKIIIITEIVVLLSLFIKIQLFNNVSQVNSQIEDVRFEIIAMDQTESQIRQIIKDLNKIKAVDQSRTDWVKYFSTTLNDLPPAPSVIIQDVNLANNEIKVSGTADSIQSFGYVIQKYLSDEFIKKIILTASKYEAKENVYFFDLTLQI